MYIVINDKYGGFGLSIKGLYHYCLKKYGQAYLYKSDTESNLAYQVPYSDNITGIHTIQYYVSPEDHKDGVDINTIPCVSHWDMERNDPALVATVRELGEEANDEYARLKVVEIPDDVNWYIEEYDGMETIHEKHRSWS